MVLPGRIGLFLGMCWLLMLLIKNKKKLCPVVVFSGVNHHNQSIVFPAAIVVKETNETYAWLLERFLEAMVARVQFW